MRHTQGESHQVESEASGSNALKVVSPECVVTFVLRVSGEYAYLVDPVTSDGIFFSRKNLLKTQQYDPFFSKSLTGSTR